MIFWNNRKSLIKQRKERAIAKRIPSPSEIWNHSQDEMLQGMAVRALNISAAAELSEVARDYLEKVIAAYLLDVVESFEDSLKNFESGDSRGAQYDISALGVRWAFQDDAVESMFVQAGFWKKFSLVETLDDIIDSLGSDAKNITYQIWQNWTDNVDSQSLICEEIPGFLSKYRADCDVLTRPISVAMRR
jgi:hypothetical protein